MKGVSEFPGGPVVRTSRSYCQGLRSTPGQGTKIPKAAQRKKKGGGVGIRNYFLNLIKMKICVIPKFVGCS